jgi:hypothetical protein
MPLWLVDGIGMAFLRASYALKWLDHWCVWAAVKWVGRYHPEAEPPPTFEPLPTFSELCGWDDD